MDRLKRQPAVPSAGSNLSSHSRLRTALPATPAYVQMREVLLAYLSAILLDSVLERALVARRLSAETLTAEQLSELASDVMVGLRLFVPEERLPQLMLELAEVLGRAK
jgi:hypothetical protein